MFNSLNLDVYCRMNLRVPPTSNYVQMAAAGRATGVWDRREHTFYFQMPPGITKASMEFSGILGHYQFDFDTSQCRGSFVGWGEYDYDYESDRFQMEREFTRCHSARPCITNHPFWRLNHRLENYNPARPWALSEPRCHHRSRPARVHSYTPTPSTLPTRKSRSVSFARNNNLPNRANIVRESRSPARPVNVNIMTHGCVMPVRHASTPTPPGPVALPPYSPPTPIYCPDSTPSLAGTNIVYSPAHCSGGSVIINSDRPRLATPVFKRQSVLTLPKRPNVCENDRNKPKLWQKVQSELLKELFSDITENIGTYSQLMEFAVKCDIPLTWLDRAKEDYPEDSQVVVNQVFYGWWDRCNLNLAKKLRMIQAAFGYIGKPPIFNSFLYTCPDIEKLLDQALSDKVPPLIDGDGKTGARKTHTLESVEVLAHKKIKTGKSTAVQHDLIHLLSEMITTQDHYEICDLLGMPPEYGPKPKPHYETWMLQTEATLLQFYIHTKSYLSRMARLRMAFNACGFLTYCDEVLVTFRHMLSAINDYARVNDPPSECPSADSCLGLGNDSPRTIRAMRGFRR